MKRYLTLPVTHGFTLVELVVVIILLAVLGAVALPRFIDTEDEARQAALETMAATLNTSAALINAQARAQGLDEGAQTLSVTGASIALHSGYPVSHWVNAMRYMTNLDTVTWTPDGIVCQAAWCGRGNQPSIPGAPPAAVIAAKIWPRGYRFEDQCGVYYINDQNGRPPQIGILSADC